MKPALILIVLVLAAVAFAYRPKTTPSTANTSPTPNTARTRPAEPSVANPDGTKKLIIRTQKLSGTSTTYMFIVADGNNQRTIFTQTADATTSYSIPTNTWSPGDNTYVFLEEKSTSGARFLVLKASGQTFSEEELYLDVNALFAQTPNKYRIRDVTGWDAPQLLHVQMVTDEGAKGPSFWFDVESRVFLQLAS